MPTRRDNGLVYSSGSGQTCPDCEKPIARCDCRKSPRAERGDGIVRIRREVKGRRGKTVTAISGIPLPEDELRALAGDLKRRCATGGSAKDGVIELQGDHRDALAEFLRERGYAVKLAGG
ncbi:MAG TPA: translation initiation factor Sui1 [Myxococcota bacterium]